MVYMNARCKKILSMLMRGTTYVPLRHIAEEMGVSKRSIYYDLCKINEWLSYYGIPEIEVVKGKGILIPEEDKVRIEETSQQKEKEENYVFSPGERTRIIYCYIMIRHLDQPVYIEQLSECCQVSRNTIFNDLRVMVAQLQEYNLILKYEKKKGYWITGDVITIRAMFFQYFSALLPLLQSGVLKFFNYDALKNDMDKLKIIEQELNTEYVDGVLLSLAALMPLMYRGRRRPYFADLKQEKIIETEEYKLVGRYFSDLEEQEQIYLSLHLLGSRVAVADLDMFYSNADQSVYEITKALVDEFEKLACVRFVDKEDLERNLFVHINTSMYRYQYGIQIGNPISEDVIREYPSLFDVTKRVSRYLEQMAGLPIPDSEVAYLALHFGSHLQEADKHASKQLRILIVCVNGVSTGNMLKREIRRLLPGAKIVAVAAEPDVSNIEEEIDLVISTIKCKTQIPSIVVHPVLTDYDRKAILNHGLVKGRKKTDDAEGIYELMKQFVPEEKQQEMREELRKYFLSRGAEESEIFTQEKPGLLDVLEKEQIQIYTESCDWKEAIYRVGHRLEEKEVIERRYLDTIIEQIQQFGSYMVIAEDILLAHASPSDGVLHLGIDMALYQEPICLPDENKARVILLLAAEDQEKHLKILKDIMNVFPEGEGAQELMDCNTTEEIWSFLRKRLQ